MSGDYTRFTFDPGRSFSGVLKQQGRVSLDADWNEAEELVDRRLRSGIYDILASAFAPVPPDPMPTLAIVPATTPSGFQIGVAPDGTLTIGQGRAYVDGIQVECFGDPASGLGAVRDPNVGGVHGAPPLPYVQQPFIYAHPAYADANSIASVGIAYLDVWEREVTASQDASLLDPALGGRDTATRVQTAWQVKVAAAPRDAVCGDDPFDWATITAPSTARLTTIKGPATPPGGPCIVQGPDGYTGLENRLYRVEVHTAGNLDESAGQPMPKYKWSSDNASLIAIVEVVDTTGVRPTITVDSTGHDAWTRFQTNDWVEFVNDDIELSMRETGAGGPLAQIHNVNEATGVITLEATAVLNAYSGAAGTNPRLVKWDAVEQTVQPSTDTGVENGISIRFEPEAGSHGDLHAGDYWVFAVRTADGSVELLDAAPPRGPLHHFAKLAVVAGGNDPTDCRTIWPPATAEGCPCEVCVTQKSHVQGSMTIQQAIDKVTEAGGGRVCICPGIYELDTGLTITDAASVHVHGVGVRTQIRFAGDGPALAIDTAVDVSVADLALFTMRASGDGVVGDAIVVNDAAGVVLERLVVMEGVLRLLLLLAVEAADDGGEFRLGTAIALSGLVAKATIRDCVLVGGTAIGGLTDFARTAADYARREARYVAGEGIARSLIGAELCIRDNILAGSDFGVQLGRATQLSGGFLLLVDRSEISHNTFVWSGQSGVDLRAPVRNGSVHIDANMMFVRGDGILLGTGNTWIEGNTIGRLGNTESLQPGCVGVGFVDGDEEVIRSSRILGNQIGMFDVAAIDIAESVHVESLIIKQNDIGNCGCGVLMQTGSTAVGLSIANNAIERISVLQSWGKSALAGILLVRATASEVVDNTILGVGGQGDQRIGTCTGIQLVACPSVRVAGNFVAEVGRSRTDLWSAGIAATSGYEMLDVADNTVTGVEAEGDWYALRVGTSDVPEPMYRLDILYYQGSTGGLSHGQIQKERPLPTGTTGVRGNEFRALGGGLIALVASNDNCTFAENRCISPEAKGFPVSLTVETLALSTNHVLGGTDRSVDVNGLRPIHDKNRYALTALGNLTTNGIMVDGQPLGQPWAPLNILHL